MAVQNVTRKQLIPKEFQINAHKNRAIVFLASTLIAIIGTMALVLSATTNILGPRMEALLYPAFAVGVISIVCFGLTVYYIKKDNPDSTSSMTTPSPKSASSSRCSSVSSSLPPSPTSTPATSPSLNSSAPPSPLVAALADPPHLKGSTVVLPSSAKKSQGTTGGKMGPKTSAGSGASSKTARTVFTPTRALPGGRAVLPLEERPKGPKPKAPTGAKAKPNNRRSPSITTSKTKRSKIECSGS